MCLRYMASSTPACWSQQTPRLRLRDRALQQVLLQGSVPGTAMVLLHLPTCLPVWSG